MRVVPGAVCAFLASTTLLALIPNSLQAENAAFGKLSYGLEWRLIRAGTVVIDLTRNQGVVKLDSAGLVSALYKVDDTFTENFDDNSCSTSSVLEGQEGHRRRKLEVQFDRKTNRASFVERDLIRDSLMHSGQVEIPNCVHNVLGAILSMRGINIAPGQSAQVPISDGRKAAMVKVDAEQREEITTPAGKFATVRYEVNIMNGVVYPRKGRVFIWFTDDSRKLPVQILFRLPFPIGSLTMQLEKETNP